MSEAPKKGQKTQALYALHWMPGLSPSARRVAAWLVWHANGRTGRCDPGQSRLIAETGLSERSVRNAVKELIETRVLRRELRGTRSSAYQLQWSELSNVTSRYEANAAQYENGRGRNLPQGGAETCRSEGQEPAPKLSEGNSVNEPMFRVGTILANGAPEQRGEEKGGDLLSIRYDEAFLAVLDRRISSGELFDRDISDRLYERLEAIVESGDAQSGDPVAGRAYRLLAETIICREDVA
ncbi:hypothetical protein BTR14_03195 [Rhizobium rhizosphaerae]|uniref:Helix-turn-helix domain-containing protein n=1 Tax=Xaviernesmea rhizosphaerae TaxID=1672749 RepID=A0ABX3PHQ8_9HYPH|nr:helix-turn-helix domain-containing protein [Xaviernesmea rhizosphaerae]OQP87588.1 hypothetical protein BTR14_03195 [Xaviernesmea rhizosphaerae]